MTTMFSYETILLFFSLSIFLLPPVLSQQSSNASMLYHDCVGKGNYTTNSPYQSNLNNLLTSIYTNTEIDYGFYNFTNGEDTDQVYAIALCRPDITADACRACIKNCSDSLRTLCPNFKEAIGGQDDCMLRYTNRSIFHLMEGGPYFWVYNIFQNVTNVTGFNQSLLTLLGTLQENASAGDSRYKYGMGQIAAPDQTIYGLAQCTPDLSASECRDCLYNASGLIPQCCEARAGGRVIYPSCNFRYEISRFYEIIESPPPPASAVTKGTGKKSNKSRVIIIVIVSTVSALMLLLFILFVLRMKKQNTEIEASRDIRKVESLQFDFETVKAATNNFSDANKLGEGGFGAVYKGTLQDGQYIAVKRLSKGSKQGEPEFKNEVLLVAKLQHRNLVRLQGFCYTADERLLLYEFVPNLSLDHYLRDPTKREILDWATRYKIIGGIAKGLVYLHEDSRLRIIHRDLKASNILLDEEMSPKISDFGTARLFQVDQTRGDTSKVVGTFGYMAPEYITRGHFSVKSDVYSFGVLVLEILSGQRIGGSGIGENEEDLLTYAWRNWNEGKALSIIDPTLSTGSTSEMTRSIHIGLLCVQEHAAERPTMAQVVIMLSSYSVTLPLPLKPAFYMHSGADYNPREAELDDSQRDSVKSTSKNEASMTDMYPR